MDLKLAEEKYNEFLEEACELYRDIDKLDNMVRAPFRKIAALLVSMTRIFTTITLVDSMVGHTKFGGEPRR